MGVNDSTSSLTLSIFDKIVYKHIAGEKLNEKIWKTKS
jgi:hypothetical protein